MSAKVRYLTDECGEKTAVILNFEDYQRLLQDLQDLADIVDRRDEPTLSHDHFLTTLREDGLLSE